MNFSTSKQMVVGSISNPQQGEPFFAAIYEVRIGPAFTNDLPLFQQFFATGSPPPAGAAWGVLNWKWGTTSQACTYDCFSNVLFLPGIESSRLYRPNSGGGEQRIWEPPLVGHDNSQLAMTASGESVAADIYTKDALDSAVGVDVYGSFISSMQGLATVSGLTFEVFPYDWRYAADTIASDPTHLAATTTVLVDEIKRLASTSKSGKVTIIAHSNGGLVAKAAMLALGADVSTYVDKLIFVAVPQVGTPQAVAGMLHGYNGGLPVSWAPLLISDEEVRELGASMPGAYGLLPSAGYFSSVSTPVITFSTTTLPEWAAQYGETITSASALDAFLTDNAGRTQPVADDLDDPLILSSGLLSDSQSLHRSLDAWTPPTGVELIQIAGWGIPTTVSGVSYERKGGEVREDTTTTIDGDGTVIVPSALWTSTSVGAENYWLDLNDYNNKHAFSNLNGLLATKHAEIMSVAELGSFMSDQITQNIQSLSAYKYLYITSPSSDDVRLVYTLHSPLTFDFYDDFGHHTGMSTTTNQMEEEIPGTYYMEFGDVKYLFTEATSSLHIFMHGYANGTFTLQAQELLGDALVATTTWANVPTTPQTEASLDTSLDLADQSPLHVDEDGDGQTDITLAPKLNDIVVPDLTPPEMSLSAAPAGMDLSVVGIDESTPVDVARDANSATITDAAGNITVLTFKNVSNRKLLTSIKITGIKYGSDPEIPLSASLTYVWGLKGQLISQTATLNKETLIEAIYNQRKDRTTIAVLSKGKQAQLQPLDGLVLIKLTTDRGMIDYAW